MYMFKRKATHRVSYTDYFCSLYLFLLVMDSLQQSLHTACTATTYTTQHYIYCIVLHLLHYTVLHSYLNVLHVLLHCAMYILLCAM